MAKQQKAPVTIGLGSDLWHLIDIWYVITGRV